MNRLTWIQLVAGLVLLAASAGCRKPGELSITPGHFRFVTVSEPDGHGGGWREVCIRARMEQDDGTGNSRWFVCDVGVGMPIQLQDGTHIVLHVAQRESASAANEAAAQVLARNKGFSAEVCQAVRARMKTLLQKAIAPAEIHACQSVMGGVEIPVVDFP